MEPHREGYVGRIPVRNIWLLMLYASDIYRVIGHGKYSVEESPEDIPDLIAELLVHTVEKRLIRNLSAGYRMTEAVQSRVRGRINFIQTESHLLLERGKIACRYEELTIDTPRNRYVRSALQHLSRIVMVENLRKRCTSLSARLFAAGVTGPQPERADISTETFGRNDAADLMMVSLARLAYDLALPTEAPGKNALNSPEREEQWIRKLFERAVGGFFMHGLDYGEWDVQCGMKLSWQISQKTESIDSIMPCMKTDIFLENKVTKHQTIIDTKFTDIVCSGWYREETLKNGYLYQIYAYLRTQEKMEDPASLCSTGILLHPAIDRRYDEAIVLDGHCIRFLTVNLAGNAVEIRCDLLKCCANIFATDQ